MNHAPKTKFEYWVGLLGWLTGLAYWVGLLGSICWVRFICAALVFGFAGAIGALQLMNELP